MEHYCIKNLLTQTNIIGSQVLLKGWVRSKRDSKAGLSFIALSDGSSFKTIQVIAENKLSNYNDEILSLTKDCAIIVEGTVVESMGSGQKIEVQATNITVVGNVENPDTYPVSQKRHTVEHLREYAHLRIRTNLISAIMRVRNTVSFAIHEYLQQNNFTWVHTPIITSSDCEGAGELFKVTTLDLNNPPKDANGKINYKEDFFGCETFLTVSGQLNAEAYCMALSKVYTFGPTFRAENSNTTRHLAEFWMVEPEMAFVDLMENAQFAQTLLKHICKVVMEKNTEEIEFFAEFQNKEVISRLEQITTQDFKHITYSEAIEYLLKSNKKFENQVTWGIDLASEHERYLCEELLKSPTIVTNYPKDIKAFYMRQNDDGKTVAAMDILAPGIGEIIGGSQREERYEILLENVKRKGIDTNTLKWYLDLRRFGSSPHSGFGIGLERLISYITGVPNIREIIPFPRAHKSISF